MADDIQSQKVQIAKHYKQKEHHIYHLTSSYIDNQGSHSCCINISWSIVFDQTLSWNKHTQQVASKINGFLHCNLYHCPVSTKLNCYKARLVVDWVCFSCCMGPPHIHLLEVVQWSAARLCYRIRIYASQMTYPCTLPEKWLYNQLDTY